MSDQKKVIIIIDGSNFYFKLKDLGLHNLLDFDFRQLAIFLAKNSFVVSSTYYIGKIKTDNTPKTKKLFDNQQKLLGLLKNSGYKYSLGYLMKVDNTYHEKGVDVNMAVDMLVASFENTCDQIILVSSDSDLIPAINKTKALGKTVEYIGFSHKPSVAMVASCSTSRLLTKEDLESLFIKKPANA